MIKLNSASMLLGPELTLAALISVNAAVMSGFDSRTATPEEFDKLDKVLDVLNECIDSLEALRTDEGQVKVS